MGDYKLVPVEITDEMAEASGCEGYFKTSPHEQAQEMWEAMLAAAPTVQGEPVAWYLPFLAGYDSLFRDHATVTSCTGNPWAGWQPLYTDKKEPNHD